MYILSVTHPAQRSTITTQFRNRMDALRAVELVWKNQPDPGMIVKLRKEGRT